MFSVVTVLGAAILAAQGLAPKQRPYDVEHYRLEVDLDQPADRFLAKVSIRLVPQRSLKELTFDCVELHVLGAALAQDQTPSGAPLAYSLKADPAHRDDGELTVQLAKPADKGKAITIAIAYEGKAGTEQNGFFFVDDPDDPGRGRLYATSFEALGARRFFPGNDEPYDRATFEVIAVVPADFEVISNGRRVLDEKLSLRGVPRRRVGWQQSKPQSTYLMALALGRFAKLEDLGGKLAYYLDPKKTDRAAYLRKSTLHSLAYFEDLLGVPYPWDGYAQVAIPTFIHGGMENTGATFEKSSAILPDDLASEKIKTRTQRLVAHELAHQWFGDLVTLKWWNDLWLNESFASYLDSLASSDFFGHEGPAVSALISTHSGYFRQEGGPLSHPIVQNELPTPNDAFDSVSYTKGENVLRMLDALVGREAFRAGMKEYLTRHALKNATTSDFIAAMEHVTGRKLSAFEQAWLRRRGFPLLKVAHTFDPKANEVRLTVQQRASSGEGTLFPFRLPVSLHRTTPPIYDLEASIDVETGKATATMKVPAEPEWITWNTKSIVLARIESRSDGEAGWVAQARRDPDAVSRVAALIELARPLLDRSQAKAGELSQVALASLADALEKDASPYVRAALFALLQETPWKTLPGALLGPAMASAVPNPAIRDSIAAVELRSHALAMLGKLGGADARALLTRALQDAALPLDLLGSAARGMAAFGDTEAVRLLDAALVVQSKRGYAYRVALATAICAVTTEDAVPRIRQVLRDAGTDSDQLRKLFWALEDNQIVLNSAQGAALARELTSWPELGEFFQVAAVELLQEARTPAVRAVLVHIREDSPSDRIRRMAERILSKNFPPTKQ